MSKTCFFGATAAVMSFALTAGVGGQTQSTTTSDRQQPDTVKVIGCLQQRGSMAAAGGGAVGTTGGAGRPTTGTPGTSTAGFVLLNGRSGLGSGSAARDSSAAPAGLSGSAAATSAANQLETGRAMPPSAPGAGRPEEGMYYLDGQDSELRDHVGHQVEITGSLTTAPARGQENGPNGRVTPSDQSDAVSNGRSEATTPGVNSRGMLAGGATPTGGSTVTAPTAAAIAGLSKEAADGARLAVQSVRMIAPNCSSR
jgi:hypothetical protein